ncbi:hypothetical protein D3C76_1702460 [compost metagenome]
MPFTMVYVSGSIQLGARGSWKLKLVGWMSQRSNTTRFLRLPFLTLFMSSGLLRSCPVSIRIAAPP